jgi:hypothetical protein
MLEGELSMKNKHVFKWHVLGESQHPLFTYQPKKS